MWDTLATYLTGVRILLRQLIFSRIDLFLIPVLRSASRSCTGWAAVFLLLFYPAIPVRAEPPGVTIVQSEASGAYLEFSDALRDILLGRGITSVVVDPAKPIPDSGLVIGVGMKAATAVAASGTPSVLNVLIPKAGHEKLLRDFPRRADPHTFSAIYLDQPLERQVLLIASILPDKHNVGLLYSTPPEELALLRRRMVAHGLKLHEQTVSQALPLAEALQALLQDSELLLVLPDSAVYNSSTIRNILLAAYRSRVPLVGFSPGYVKAGALCAVSSTPAQIAMQAAALIRQFGETHALPSAQYPQEFEVTVNEQVARSLGLQVKDTSVLHDEIKAAERDAP